MILIAAGESGRVTYIEAKRIDCCGVVQFHRTSSPSSRGRLFIYLLRWSIQGRRVPGTSIIFQVAEGKFGLECCSLLLSLHLPFYCSGMIDLACARLFLMLILCQYQIDLT